MFQIRRAGAPVSPRSIKNIRAVAQSFREKFTKALSDFRVFCPITSILDLLGTGEFEEYSFMVVDGSDPSMQGKWAFTDPERKSICISQEIYDKACENDPQARFTIAHELGHIFLDHKRDAVFARNNVNAEIPAYRDSEWQADTFAAELLMPAELARGKRAKEMEALFGVSASAAQAREDRLRKEI